MAHLAWVVWLLGFADAGAAGDAADCRRTAAGVGAWIKTVVAAAAQPGVPMTIAPRLVTFQGAAGPEAAPLVEVTSHRVSVNGQMHEGCSKQRIVALRAGWRQLNETHRLLHPGGPAADRVLLAVDRDVPWSQLVEVTGTLAAEGVRNVDWVFASKRTQGAIARPPARSSVDADLAAIRALTDPADKAVQLAAVTARVVAPCPSVRELVAGMAALDPVTRSALLADKLAPAVAACGCTLDVNALEALLFVSLDPGGDETQSVVRLRLAGTGGRPLKAAADAPWATGFRQLVDAVRGRGATTSYRLIAR